MMIGKNLKYEIIKDMLHKVKEEMMRKSHELS
jgi:hypothetical protein